MAQELAEYFGYFRKKICRQDVSKIAQNLVTLYLPNWRPPQCWLVVVVVNEQMEANFSNKERGSATRFLGYFWKLFF